jgi:hypothetical protein
VDVLLEFENHVVANQQKFSTLRTGIADRLAHVGVRTYMHMVYYYVYVYMLHEHEILSLGFRNLRLP